MSTGQKTVSVIDSAGGECPMLPLVDGEGHAKAIMWPGNGAEHRSFHLIELARGAKTVALSHAGESVYYIISGGGVIEDLAASEFQKLVEGAMVHIGGGDHYRFAANAGLPMKILGGPCPADPSLYQSLKPA